MLDIIGYVMLGC